jgi:hypothetical protein
MIKTKGFGKTVEKKGRVKVNVISGIAVFKFEKGVLITYCTSSCLLPLFDKTLFQQLINRDHPDYSGYVFADHYNQTGNVLGEDWDTAAKTLVERGLASYV